MLLPQYWQYIATVLAEPCLNGGSMLTLPFGKGSKNNKARITWIKHGINNRMNLSVPIREIRALKLREGILDYLLQS